MVQRLKPESFDGEVKGKPVGLYLLKNKNGMEAAICNWGARICQILAPDREGRLDDVVFGYDTLEKTLAGLPEMGALIGRVANRIAQARFDLNGRSYRLEANDGPHCLHSGPAGCMRSVFDVDRADGRSLKMSLELPDGMDGFPGNCMLSAVYELNDENELTMTLEAVTDAPTLVNFCNHAYFNLSGTAHSESDILEHRLQLNADRYTLTDETLVPTGEIAPVAGTPLDFTQPHAIGERIDENHEQLRRGRGYDHNFILNKAPEEKSTSPVFAARLSEPRSGRALEVWTTEPGIQLYTGNFLHDGCIGKNERVMFRRSSLCLETQHFPDAIHHPNFPGIVLNPGERYASTTKFRFGTK